MQLAEKQFNIDPRGETITVMNTSSCHQYIRGIPFASVRLIQSTNWHHNRQPDDNRVAQIKEYITQYKKIDGIIYLAALHDKLVCYDGAHRLAAINAISKDKPLTWQGFGYSPVLISFMFVGGREGVVIDHFRSLNAGLSIPDIYTDAEGREDKRKVVKAICSHYKGAYPSFFVGTTAPQRPHENESMFETKLGALYDNLEETCKNLNSDGTLLKILADQNEYYKQHLDDIPKMPDKRKQKCIAADFYLFIMKGWESDALATYRNGLIFLE